MMKAPKWLIWIISNASERQKHTGTRSEIKSRVHSVSTL